MNLTNNLVVVLFVTFMVGIYCADTYVNKVPTRIIQSPSTEEMWVYLIKPMPTGAVYLFYQKEASQVKLTSADSILEQAPHNNNPCGNPNTDSVNTNPSTRELKGAIPFNSWIHVVVTRTIIDNKNIQVRLYVNDKCSEILKLTAIDIVTLGLTIEHEKSKVFDSFSVRIKCRLVELHLSPKL